MAARKADARPEGATAPAAFLALVDGRVQGVGFRYSAMREARRLGLRGWVRNLEDGSVEAYAEGSASALEHFEDWLRRGPPGAWVQELHVSAREPRGEYSDFTVEF